MSERVEAIKDLVREMEQFKSMLQSGLDSLDGCIGDCEDLGINLDLDILGCEHIEDIDQSCKIKDATYEEDLMEAVALARATNPLTHF